MVEGEKSFPCKSFTRVRPFTKAEAEVAPAESPLPREIITWDRGQCLTVLDAEKNFAPRKNGTFRLSNILWSFEDDEVKDIKPVNQASVYKQCVAPTLASLSQGYSMAYMVAGAASSGRFYTMFGNLPKDPAVGTPDEGLLFRFARNVFPEIEKVKEEESVLTCEMQAFEISGENYVDCLAPAKKGSGKEVELKLVPSPEGPKLAGAHTVYVSTTEDLLKQFTRLHPIMKKRSNSTCTICLKFTETFEFNDPELEGQPVRKSRHFYALFVLLRHTPAAFTRCLTVAVEHDTGANPLAKVPVREAALTRLYPDIFLQGYALNVISCVSPYFEHAKETLNTLSFSEAVQQLVGKPKRHQDAKLLEMRRLAEEVKELKTEVRKKNDSMAIVQKEVNAREMELIKKEEIHARAREDLDLAKEDLQLAIIGRNYQVDKSLRARKEIQLEIDSEKKQIKAIQREIDHQNDERDKVLHAVRQAELRVAALETHIETEKKNKEEYNRRVEAIKNMEREIEQMEIFNSSPLEEQEKVVLMELAAEMKESGKSEGISKEIAIENDAIKALDGEINALEPTYQQIEKAEAVAKTVPEKKDAPEGCCLVM